MPFLQSLTSLLIRLLLLPDSVRMPVPEQPAMLLFSIELQKGPFRTKP